MKTTRANPNPNKRDSTAGSKNFRLRDALVVGLLIIVTAAIFWQVLGHGFVDFDDDKYITNNRHIQQGFTMQNVVWAFTTFYGANWNPMLWMSFFTDCKLFGMGPMGFHLSNLLFHIANTILLFWILRRTTGSTWRSAFVAALFALHPLHVESVAWVTERKDTLSAFFWMLTI